MPTKKQYPWVKLKDSELLELRFCDLNLEIKNSRISPHIAQLKKELRQRGINFNPHIWISQDWFAMDGIPGIAVPFYIMHERIAKLSRKLITDIEGFNNRDCIKLLRHEAGHAIDNAYKLRLSRKRQKLFGLSSEPYPDYYSPRAYSKKYVVHLNSWYAQAHPDEDWAETFAVWLNPKSNWKQRYKNWPAINKLKMVDSLMKEIKKQPPYVTRTEQPGDITKSRKKLKTFYKEKREALGLEKPFYLEPLLVRLFSAEKEFKKKKKAYQFIKDEKPLIREKVARWTGQYKYTIDLMLNEVIQSCKEKKLHLIKSERETRLDLVGMLTAQTLNYINSGHHKIAM